MELNLGLYAARAPVTAIPWYLSGGISLANCLAAYQPKGAASLAASYTNLANAGTYDAAPGNAPTWDAANGWKFATASNHWLGTGITPVNNRTWSMIVQFTNSGTGGSWPSMCGMWQSSGIGFAITNGTGSKRGFYNGGFSYGGAQQAAGNLCVAGTKGYYNGADEGITIPGGGAAFSYTITIGAVNNVGVIYTTLNVYIQAFAIYNVTLTAGQVSALATAMVGL